MNWRCKQFNSSSAELFNSLLHNITGKDSIETRYCCINWYLIKFVKINHDPQTLFAVIYLFLTSVKLFIALAIFKIRLFVCENNEYWGKIRMCDAYKFLKIWTDDSLSNFNVAGEKERVHWLYLLSYVRQLVTCWVFLLLNWKATRFPLRTICQSNTIEVWTSCVIGIDSQWKKNISQTKDKLDQLYGDHQFRSGRTNEVTTPEIIKEMNDLMLTYQRLRVLKIAEKITEIICSAVSIGMLTLVAESQ